MTSTGEGSYPWGFGLLTRGRGDRQIQYPLTLSGPVNLRRPTVTLKPVSLSVSPLR